MDMELHLKVCFTCRKTDPTCKINNYFLLNWPQDRIGDITVNLMVSLRLPHDLNLNKLDPDPFFGVVFVHFKRQPLADVKGVAVRHDFHEASIMWRET